MAETPKMIAIDLGDPRNLPDVFYVACKMAEMQGYEAEFVMAFVAYSFNKFDFDPQMIEQFLESVNDAHENSEKENTEMAPPAFVLPDDGVVH